MSLEQKPQSSSAFAPEISLPSAFQRDAAALQELRERCGAGDVPNVAPGERGDPGAVLRWAEQTFGTRVALVSSLGPQTLVLVDWLHREGLELPVLFIDTDLHFALTYALRREVERRYGIEVVNLRTDLDLTTQAELHGESLWDRDPDLCCSIRKVEPLRRGLSGFDAWVTGLRRDQSAARLSTEAVEWDSLFGLFKINPLVGWKRADVHAYLDEHRVPYNPLLDDGYTSIGCSPCTRRTSESTLDERAGRWAGSAKTECGLHAPTSAHAEREGGAA